MKNEFLRLDYISIFHNEYKVLKNICLNVFKGEIVKLFSEECEGKDALLDILGGICSPGSGNIYINGKEFTALTPQISHMAGISIIRQKSDLIANLTVMENFFLDPGVLKNRLFFNNRQQHQKCWEVLQTLGVSFTTDTLVRDLPPEYVQMVQLGKALLKDPQLIILDHSATILNFNQSKLYKNVFEALAKKNVSVIIISQNLDDFADIASRIYIMQDGSIFANTKSELLDRDKILQVITRERFNRKADIPAVSVPENVLRVENISTRGILKKASFSLNKGEILGITGPINSGKTELAYTLLGRIRRTEGTVYLHGKKVTIQKPSDAINLKMALIAFEEGANPLFPNMTLRENITIAKLKSISRLGLIDPELEKWLLRAFSEKFDLNEYHFGQPANKLSAGELRKLSIFRTLMYDPQVLVFIEPTKGISSSDRNYILNLLTELSHQGVSIILVSSDIYEIVRIATRVLIINDGCMTGEINGSEITLDMKLV
jgi:ribose transport system ATP-binding protein